ncbi:hypothetical protein M9435_004835 [Picochlorum sp. BPE23]|nr:hypothetical protein M9435_004835 [Picochlorum sp. BPE23]
MNFLSKSNHADSIKETRSGFVFPGELCLRPQDRRCPRITGVGTRQKRLAGIKSLDIYAVALYVDESGVTSLLGDRALKSADEDSFAHDDAMFADLMKHSSLEKALRVVITSALVKRKAFVSALDEQLKPPLSGTASEETLANFGSMFDSVSFRKGMDISFFFERDAMITKVDGQEIGRLRDDRFSKAFLNLYLGSSPVSVKAKEEFGRGIYSMVTQKHR